MDCGFRTLSTCGNIAWFYKTSLTKQNYFILGVDFFHIFIFGSKNLAFLPPGTTEAGHFNLDHYPETPTNQWQPGKLYIDSSITISLPDDHYQFEVGFVDLATGQRLQ